MSRRRAFVVLIIVAIVAFYFGLILGADYELATYWVGSHAAVRP